MPELTNLFDDFDAISLEEWKAKVIKDLKGKPFDSLQWQLSEDIKMEPFYTSAKENTAFPHKENNNWQIAEDFIINHDFKSANKQLLDALMAGIDAPQLHIEASLSEKDWAAILNEVELDYISLHLCFHEAVSSQSSLDNFKAYATSIGKKTSEIAGSISGAGFQKGLAMKSVDVIANGFYTDTASIPTELAKTIKLAVDQIMAASEKAGIEEILSSVFFNISIGKSYFPAIAKTRALDIIWQRICQGFKTAYVAPEIAVNFAASAYGDNPNTNMIRATTMAMSAVLGGADRLVVLPSNLEEKVASSFSRRIARNVQHLLKMESFLDQVADPASGSYYIEQMTSAFVEKAWQQFLELEKA